MKFSKEQWASIVRNFDPSTQTLTSYCENLSISKSNFYYHKSNMTSAVFLPVIVSDNEKIDFEVNGLKLSVAHDMNPEHLSVILKAFQYD